MELKRSNGILLHPTSLPGKDGVGDLGQEAYIFVDFLARNKQKVWQILPLGPVGYGESPYQSLSAFAGNHYLISLDKLVEEGLLDEKELADRPSFPTEKVDYPAMKDWKDPLLKRAAQRFINNPKSREYLLFLEENSIWLNGYALFMALKEHFQGLPWNEWGKDIAFGSQAALNYYSDSLGKKVEEQFFLQFTFYQQWLKLKEYANKQGIKIMGDLPIFISADSSDAWANPHLFELDKEGNPTKVAGVPPDYFSETGQLWGNPHYKWEEMAKDEYLWWRKRFSFLLNLVDIIRVDHFRGFEAYWEIPGGEETAVNGKWVKAPGKELFTIIKKYLGELPIVAEDLGVITEEVEELKNEFDFPGMKVLQFSLNNCQDRRKFLCSTETDSVVYTGTHDNNTLLGWYRGLAQENPKLLKFFRRFLGFSSVLPEEKICWSLIKLTLGHSANLAVLPLQDILCLGEESRMNQPGTTAGNWKWRFSWDDLDQEKEKKLKKLTLDSKRSV